MPRRLHREDVLVIASHNEGKVREIAALIEPYVREVRSAAQLHLPEPIESGESFRANAAIKAIEIARASSLVALADDSGLSVASLDGAPGVRSARWAVPDFSAAMERVERELGTRTNREASMVTALALAWPDGHVEVFEGSVGGTLVWPPRGTLGFGYEPIFVPHGESRTYGEMPRAEKHEDDPRARAFAALRAACTHISS